MDFAFSALVIDRAGEARQDAAWIEDRFSARDARCLVLSSDGCVLIAQPERRLLDLPLPLLRDRFASTQFSFLGHEGNSALFVLTLDVALVVEFAAGPRVLIAGGAPEALVAATLRALR